MDLYHEFAYAVQMDSDIKHYRKLKSKGFNNTNKKGGLLQEATGLDSLFNKLKGNNL